MNSSVALHACSAPRTPHMSRDPRLEAPPQTQDASLVVREARRALYLAPHTPMQVSEQGSLHATAEFTTAPNLSNWQARNSTEHFSTAHSHSHHGPRACMQPRSHP